MTDLRTQLQSTLGDGYTLERELGGGGMSRVFVARDNSLGREVVVKVLAPELSAEVSAERFAREIATAARLQQANIVPVLASGASAGLPYYTMPFVKGESLRALLARGTPLPLHDRLNVLRDVARALAYAHGEGVVHRDIKPDNVLLSAGTAVVTDFGIAKAISASRTHDGSSPANDGTLTQAGSSIGTPAYMAPEQAVGEAVDHRADIYAWGVLAYELLSGAHPFAGKTGASQLIAAHLAEMPVSLEMRAPELPREVAALVMQCLAKKPSDRPAAANVLLERLAAVSTPSAERAAERSDVPVRVSSQRGIGIAALLLVSAAAAIWFVKGRDVGGDASAGASAAAQSEALSSLAVLPFVNTSGNAQDEYFSDGLTDELSHALSKLPGLRLAGRSSSFSFKGKSVPASEVGEALGVSAIVEGTVRRAGDRIRLTAQLTSTRDGQVLWSDAFERTGADVFAVQDAFTSAIVAALTPRLGNAAGANPATSTAGAIAARGTADAEAYDLYLKGRYYWAQRGADPLDSAVKYLEASVQRDSTFARGWAALALAYVIRPNFNTRVTFATSDAKTEVAVRRAVALDSTVADAYVARGFSATRQLRFADAATALANARRLDPGSAIAAHWSAIYFNVIGDTLQADEYIERALALDPLSGTTFNSRARMLLERRQFARALENHARAASLSETFMSQSATTLLWAGFTDSAFPVAQRGLTTQVRARYGVAVLTAAAAGDWEAARRLRRQIEARGEGVTPYDRAVSALVFGDRAAATVLFVDHLENDGGFANIVFSICDPVYDAIRTEPVWQAFLATHQMKDCPYTSPWPIGAAPR